MYKFSDLAISREIETNDLPIEALNYGGHWLDREVEGYTTLVTSGRHEFEREVSSDKRVGDGEIYYSSRIEKRTIEITFQLLAKTIEEYNHRLEKLKEIIYVPNQRFYFADEQEYSFIGTVTALKFDSDLLNTTGKITIEVSDPYKLGKEVILKGTDSKVTINNPELTYPQTPNKIIFIPSATLANPVIKCGSKQIIMNMGVDKGQPWSIDFENLMVEINNINSMAVLRLTSNLSDFYIQNGSVIDFGTTGNYEIRYEVKRL